MALGVRLGGQDLMGKAEHPLTAEQIGVKTCGKESMDGRIKHVEPAAKAA